ncbi:ABC transporter permease [Streptomyces orinoci]|uniref:Transport permease protein n=1 Tax=Streptomyces orinoci TaxID=67339 RepID=A0ABV3K698_STRON|nr:ABC transporter permease [Streptomyces orinoci]
MTRTLRLFRHTRLVFVRSAQPWLRSPALHIVAVFSPLLYLVLFGPLVKNALPPKVDAWQWFVPGMLMQLTLFGAAYAGFAITPELRSGVTERLRVTPVSRLALLLGRVLGDMAQLVIQGGVLLAAATAFGFRTPVLAVVLALALAAVLGAAISSLSYALALTVKEENKFAPLLNMMLVPLMLLSGVLLPMDNAPGWLHTLSRINPLSHVVEALRAITAGHYGSTAAVQGTLITVVMAVVCGLLGWRTMARNQA